MEAAVDDDSIWLAEIGRDADFYSEVRGEIKALPKGTTVIYGLGVNDLYMDAHLKNLADLVKIGHRVIYIGVTPVNDEGAEDYGYDVRDEHVRRYNKKMLKHLPEGVEYLDGYSYLAKEGFDACDGLHYSPSDYAYLYEFIINNI